MGEMILKATGLCKDYGKKSVLHNVDFTINKGDIYGLVGKNGAGKTTIMRIITGLQVPTKGEVEYGFDRSRLGSVGQIEIRFCRCACRASVHLFQYVG